MIPKPVVKKALKQPITGTALVPAKKKVAPVKKLAPVKRKATVVKKRTTTTTTTSTSKAKPAVAATPADPFADAVKAAENQKFAPVEASIQSQQRAQVQRKADLGGWFQNYQKELAAANAAAAQAGSQTQQNMAAFLGAGAANDAQGASANAAQMQADAAARGASVDPGVLQQAIDAGAVRRDNGAGLGKLLGVNIQADAGKNAGVARNASAQKVQALLNNAQVQDRLGKSLTDLAGQRGDFRIAQRAALVSEAQDAALKNYLATGQLNVDQQKADTAATKVVTDSQTRLAAAKINAQTALEKQRASAVQHGRDLNKFGVSNAAWNEWGKSAAGRAKREAAMKATGRSKGKSAKSNYLPRAGQNTAKKAIDAAVVAVKAQQDKYSEGEVRQLLLNGRPAQTIKIDVKSGKLADADTPKENVLSKTIPAVRPLSKDDLNVAMDIAYRAGISPANVKALHTRGVKVKELGYKVLGPKDLDPQVDPQVANRAVSIITGKLGGGG